MEEKVTTVIGKSEMKPVCNVDDLYCDILALFQPGDIKMQENSLYIADTNNHLVRILKLNMKVLRTLSIKEWRLSFHALITIGPCLHA